ncbi:MAG TPA: hypothetical protein VNQ33_09335 [Acidimicrobiales bacterium]|nr:hypothetical protein [Acidimicrobiales bacterium]
MPPDRSRRIDRSQLPGEFTPETVRRLGMRTARALAHPDNGVLTPEEQVAFDRVLREVMQESAERLGRSVGRSRRPPPPDADPHLRRSYLRTQQRLDAQAERARQAFPQLAGGWADPAPPARPVDGAPVGAAPVDPARPVGGVEAAADGAADDEVSVGAFEHEIEQTSDTLEILEQIAGIQQQQLEHQRSQLLSETRGLFFALAVSVAVIIAGVAPLVSASPHDRRSILAWTAIVCAVGGVAYAIVRSVQAKAGRPD